MTHAQEAATIIDAINSGRVETARAIIEQSTVNFRASGDTSAIEKVKLFDRALMYLDLDRPEAAVASIRQYAEPKEFKVPAEKYTQPTAGDIANLRSAVDLIQIKETEAAKRKLESVISKLDDVTDSPLKTELKQIHDLIGLRDGAAESWLVRLIRELGRFSAALENRE